MFTLNWYPQAEVSENKFKVGDKLEAVDKQNPDLTCVATVTDVVSNNILVHFDGWAHDFDYWCNISSNYIHPVGWCQANDKLLSPPEGKLVYIVYSLCLNMATLGGHGLNG